MAKARRRLSDLVHEETQKIREPNLQTWEVPKSVGLSENPSEAEVQVADLQTLEATNSVTLSESEPLSKTEQQADNVTDLQTLEATNSESLLETPSEVEDKVTEQQAYNVTDLQTNKYSESVSSTQIAIEREGEEVNKTTKLQDLQDTDLQSTELPKYLKLERKEARLRQDQIDALTDLTRKLNRTKQVKGGERLTDNTLIRVAIDLLLSKASELQGTTEDELRSSLTL
ncbi:hypothetical protein LC605_10115 [Nostoc sp. CHAB 5836]|uniref:hypothetical protein n=1 Tax=Nostoc sp. CHAB 5836 TaxID=2780404 RepID=UPI001E4A63CE|nr:hypothetical protein [Nostoc sp. CHAB 5836]MCC5615421.1 hypothetical protein [Nostoc sp. CHAB 5836]